MKIATTLLAALLAVVPMAATHAAKHTGEAALAEAEVRKVDRDANKVTLKHGEIKNLDMPPMTMVFVARDPAMLDKVKAGDKVRFKAEKIGGAYTVTHLEGAK